jgi:hypothetical protein
MDLAARVASLQAQVQMMYRVLWLSLDQGGSMSVSSSDLLQWPDGRKITQDKNPETGAITWTAASTKIETPEQAQPEQPTQPEQPEQQPTQETGEALNAPTAKILQFPQAQQPTPSAPPL